jgi:hypothetical protein
VSEWNTVFLGIIALAVSVMAAIQVGIIVYGGRLARRVDALTTQVEREIKPLLAHLTTIGEEAARASTLAAAQVERVDRLFADVSLKVEETAHAVQSAIVAPAREGLALLSGVKAAFEAVRGMRQASAAPTRTAAHDDEDPLFIG